MFSFPHIGNEANRGTDPVAARVQCLLSNSAEIKEQKCLKGNGKTLVLQLRSRFPLPTLLCTEYEHGAKLKVEVTLVTKFNFKCNILNFNNFKNTFFSDTRSLVYTRQDQKHVYII